MLTVRALTRLDGAAADAVTAEGLGLLDLLGVPADGREIRPA